MDHEVFKETRKIEFSLIWREHLKKGPSKNLQNGISQKIENHEPDGKYPQTAHQPDAKLVQMLHKWHCGVGNLNFLLQIQETKLLKSIPHGDTLNYLLEKLPPEALGRIRTQMIHGLIRQKCFENERLLDKYHLVGADGTELFSRDQRHCDSCLTRTVKKGKRDKKQEVLQYYHRVLEAKLLCSSGMVLSVETEFIANEARVASISEESFKQDCELNAFKRLEKQLKADFPQLSICLLLDGLFAGKPVFDICKKNGWGYLITFKEGSMPAVYQEFLDLLKLVPENQSIEKEEDGTQRVYRWVCDIEYEGHRLNVLECVEIQPDGTSTRFVWLTNLSVTQENCIALAKAGRRRWKIENEGFNMQKNGGYGLEHMYSEDPVALKNFYVLLQMAHAIRQLLEKGNLLKEILKVYGSLKNFTLKLWSSFTQAVFDSEEWEALKIFLSKPRQIRLNTG